LEEVILLLAGLVSIAIEVFLLPGFGVAGILGIVLLGAAIVLAMLGSSPSWTDIAQSLAVLGASLILTLTVIVTWFRHLPNSTRFRGLLLKEGLHSGEGYVSAVARNDLVGKDAVALTDLRPSGTVEIGGERIDVVTEGDYVRAGTTVRIVRAEGHRHVVRANS
jgi:membrane-bound serine protease (ClpP class)